MGAFAFILLIPIVLLICSSYFVNSFISVCAEKLGISKDIFIRETDWGQTYSSVYGGAIAVFFLVLWFLIMMWYGYFKAGKIYPKKNMTGHDSGNSTVIYRTPEDRTRIYTTLFFPLVWYLIWNAVMNFFDLSRTEDLFGILIQVIVTFCPYGALAWDSFSLDTIFTDEIHIILLLNLLYYTFVILSFAAGERLYVRKRNETLKPFVIHKKKLIIFCSIAVSVYSLSEFVLYQHRKNIVPTAHPAYGFAYEAGYSSTSLELYYVENESNILAKLDEPSTFTISDPIDMPVLDGAEAAYPVYSAFANACYENIADIQSTAKEQQYQKRRGKLDESIISVMPVQFSNTIYAYEKLLAGEVDICFGARPSEEQLQMAEDAGKEVILTPIGKEGFIFFVNDANPVDGLTIEQIKDIYSGKIKNWSKVGGDDEKILAFQRPENSGSQTMMKYFMGDTPLKDPLEAEYYESMGGILKDVAAYDNGKASIGYSFRYFVTLMIEKSSRKSIVTSYKDELKGLKFLTIDDVYPDEETIRSGEYPLTTQLYAITVIDKNSSSGTYSKDTIAPFLEWMAGPQGQKIVADTGYISLY